MAEVKINFEDNLMALLRELVSTGRIKASYTQLYEAVNKYWKGGDFVNAIIMILREWGATPNLKTLAIEQLGDTENTVLIPICKNITENNTANMKMNILISIDGDKVKLFDTDKGYYVISTCKLDSIWNNGAIEFGVDASTVGNGPEECEKPFVSVLMPVYNQAEYVVAVL